MSNYIYSFKIDLLPSYLIYHPSLQQWSSAPYCWLWAWIFVDICKKGSLWLCQSIKYSKFTLFLPLYFSSLLKLKLFLYFYLTLYNLTINIILIFFISKGRNMKSSFFLLVWVLNLIHSATEHMTQTFWNLKCSTNSDNDLHRILLN